MKKILLSTLILGFSTLVWGQTQVKSSVRPAAENPLLNNSSLKNKLNTAKTLACVDTIRYPQVKEQILGTSNFYTFELWADDNESMSQTFLLSGSTIGITGVEFFGRNKPGGTASVTVRASVYNVDGSNNPTTEIAFANITLADTNFAYRQVNFAPITVSGNYAVVIRPTNLGGIVDFYVNDAAPSQTYDENLSRAKSDFYTSSNGNWVNIPTYTVSGFTGGPFDFEMLAAPKITYTINTDFTASPTPSCLGTPVTFTNTTTPTSILNSRFYNYQEFRTYFQTVPDSTYAYAMGGATPLIWSENTTFTYATAANHTPILYTLGGFWNSCLDNNTKTVSVNPLPTVTASPAAQSFCIGDSVPITASGAATYTWAPATGLSATTGATVIANPTATTTYTVTGTDANNCQNTAQVTVTVNPLPTVTANATATTICAGGQVTLTGGGATSYTWDNGVTNGVAFSPTATTTYTVTGTNANSCQNTAQVTVTVASAITVTANATSTSVCVGNPVTLTGSGATSYTWDNGVTDGVAFTPSATTTYNVTGTSGTCTGTDQITITVNPVPASDFTFVNVCFGTATPFADQSNPNGGTITNWNWDFTNNGTVDNTTQNPTNGYPAAGNYTVELMVQTALGCKDSITKVVTVNPVPVANFTALSVCLNTPTQFNDLSTITTGNIVNWLWDFGDGVGTSTAQNPSYSYSAANIYNVTLTITSDSGCINTIVIPITVTTVDATTTTTGTTITANNSNATYQWVDCNNSNQPISGATSQNFTPTVTGNYAVVVTENGCSDTSACENIIITGINEMNANNNISVYPNPVNDIFTISSSDDLSGTVVKIIAITGQTLVEKTIISGNTATFDMRVYATGLYFVEINQKGVLNTLKVIKK